MDFKRNEQGQLVEVLEQPVTDEEARELELHNELTAAQSAADTARLNRQQADQESKAADEIADLKAKALDAADKLLEAAEASLTKSGVRVDAWTAARSSAAGHAESSEVESDDQDDAGESAVDDAPDSDEYQSEAQSVPTHVSTAAEG